ncbi:MAG: D-ribose pyranase [Firmicutes bacterium]|jgi:D-ribose pyranase|nr:D-ribose pyranase [Bacillota bacterium]
MKNRAILNPQISAAIAKLGHTEYFVIADAGLPIPANVELIDLSLTRGIPRFIDVVRAVAEELVVESCIYASELPEQNEEVFTELELSLRDLPKESVSHEEFKNLVKSSRVVIRTGECSPYSNVILVGGVNF